MAKRATLADVAARAGLSKTAVSFVLNDRPDSRLSADAVARVKRAAAELDYRPNPAARSLRMQKTRIIGFVSDDVTVTRFASAMIRGLLDVAGQREHTVLIAETGSDLAKETSAVELMLDHRADGIIFGLMGAKLIDLPERPSGTRTVILNGTTSTGESTILPDEYTAGYEITKLLLDHGHRRVALIGDFPEGIADQRISATIGQRFAGIEAALADAGVELLARVRVDPWEPALGRDATIEVLDGLEGFEGAAAPTGLICLNDRLAFGAYQAIQERGMRVPHDISIVSFDDDEIADYLRPGLTTARIPYEEMGRQAVEVLLADGAGPEHRLVPMPIIERESVRRI